MALYDTHSSIQRLIEAGIPEAQAAAIVREQFQFVNDIATKHDLHLTSQALRAEIQQVKDDLHLVKEDVRLVKEDLRLVRDEVRGLELHFTAEIREAEARLLKYFTGLAVAMTGAIVTLVKFA